MKYIVFVLYIIIKLPWTRSAISSLTSTVPCTETSQHDFNQRIRWTQAANTWNISEHIVAASVTLQNYNFQIQIRFMQLISVNDYFDFIGFDWKPFLIQYVFLAVAY